MLTASVDFQAKLAEEMSESRSQARRLGAVYSSELRVSRAATTVAVTSKCQARACAALLCRFVAVKRAAAVQTESSATYLITASARGKHVTLASDLSK